MVGTKKERITTLEDQVTQLKSMVNYLVKRIEMNEKVVDKLGDIVDDFLDAYSGATLHGPQIISTAKSEISELGCAWAKEGNDLEDDFSETLHVYYNDVHHSNPGIAAAEQISKMDQERDYLASRINDIEKTMNEHAPGWQQAGGTFYGSLNRSIAALGKSRLELIDLKHKLKKLQESIK